LILIIVFALCALALVFGIVAVATPSWIKSKLIVQGSNTDLTANYGLFKTCTKDLGCSSRTSIIPVVLSITALAAVGLSTMLTLSVIVIKKSPRFLCAISVVLLIVASILIIASIVQFLTFSAINDLPTSTSRQGTASYKTSADYSLGLMLTTLALLIVAAPVAASAVDGLILNDRF
ncbi:unnamed protein product, partial [Didymodactylos carnosus]